MANFNFNVTEESTFSVELISLIETDCASQYIYKVNAEASDSIDFSLSSDNGSITWNSQSYEILSVTNTDWVGTAVKTVVYNTDLYIKFSIENSGTPGLFNNVLLIVDIPAKSFTFKDYVTRDNDNASCESIGGTYDELTDTPNNKTGSALKVVRVNASETAHEYVDIGAIGIDLNYSEAFTSSASWVINHNLGKIPSVTVIDNSGNTIHGDAAYTDLNNLTITFNTAFAGTVYLN